MKTNLLILLSLFVAIFVTSCSDDNENTTDSTLNYTIEVKYPEAYTVTQAAGVTVKLKNTSNNRETILVTNESGLAIFSDLAPGNYSVTATQELTAEQAESITGYASDVYLNATIAQFSILGEGNQVLQLEASALGDWVIKEFYYSGAPDSYYFYDSYIEIFNNSTETLYADGLLIGTTKAATTSSSSFYGFVTTGLQDAYVSTLLQVPGTGNEYPVEPGNSIVVAIDAINHKTDPNGNANSPVNLGRGIADFEVYYYVNPNTPDTDNPDVPNVSILHAYSTTLFDYIPGVMGSGLVIFRNDNPEALERVVEPNITSSTLYVRVPKENVIDALDATATNSIAPEYKRIPTNLDAGMKSVNAAYTGTSLRRKVKKEINGRKILLDTNNSSNDFEVNNLPNPKGW